jgi:Ca2+-binding EF-hand superfamily protein
MPHGKFFPLAALAVSCAMSPAGSADDTPPDSKSGARPELKALDKNPRQLFRELDKNGDGKLTPDEVSDDRRPFFDHLMRVADKDQSGDLTQAEFVDGLTPVERRPAAANADSSANRADSPAASPKLVTGSPGMRGDPGLVVIRKLDKNGDGKLSKAEWQYGSQLFDELDIDRSGSLEPRELTGIGPDGRPMGRQAMPPAEKPAEIDAAKNAGRPSARPPTSAGSSKPLVTFESDNHGSPADRNDQRTLRRTDVNGDGRISRVEARGRLKANFDRLDADGDRYLSRDELERALEILKTADRSN